MELVLPMHNVHSYFSLKIWAKKCSLFTATNSTLKATVICDLKKLILF